MHAQKGPLVWLDYDYRFRVRRERTGAPWNVFNYPLYSSVKAKCKIKAANTSVTAQPFRDYVTKSTSPHSSRVCYNFNKGRCSKRDCNYTHGCSFCKNEHLVTGFTDGFRMPSSIPSDPPKHEYENHRSVRDNLDNVQQKLNKDLYDLFTTLAFPKPTRLTLTFCPNSLRLLSKC